MFTTYFGILFASNRCNKWTKAIAVDWPRNVWQCVQSSMEKVVVAKVIPMSQSDKGVVMKEIETVQ